MMTRVLIPVGTWLLPIVMAVFTAEARASALERLSFDGDLRLRYETIDVEGADRDARERLRARGGFEFAASEDLDFVLRVATGGHNPVSANKTLDGDYSMDDLRIDRAYVDWRLGESLAMRLGKMKQPWMRPAGSQLVWDSDFNPEGLALRYASGMFQGSVAALQVDGSSSGNDSRLYAVQAAVTASAGERNRAAAGLGYFDYANARGREPFFDGKPRGNRVGPDGTYLSGFRLVDLFAEFRTTVWDRPLTLFADVVQNTAAQDEKRGYSAGATLGNAAEPGGFQAGYAWIDSQADAVVATFSNSDFAGGNSNSRGHFITATYRLRDHIELGATVILSERSTSDVPAQDYDRLMLDIEFIFD